MFTDTIHTCTECNVAYSPLVYQAGYITESQHFHDVSGGVYCVTTPSDFTGALYPNKYFLANVTTFGRRIEKDEYYSLTPFSAVKIRQVVQSERILVNAITPKNNNTNIRSGFLVATSGKSLIPIENLESLTSDPVLINMVQLGEIVCDITGRPQIPYSFIRKDNGEISFHLNNN